MAEITRVTQCGFNVLADADVDIRVTQSGVNVLGAATPPIRVTQSGVNVLGSVPTPSLSALAVSSTRIDLTLGAGPGATSHKLYQSTTEGFVPGPATLVATYGAAPPATVASTGLIAGQTYHFALVASVGTVSATARASAQTPGVGTPPTLRVGGITDTEALLSVDNLPAYLEVRFHTSEAGVTFDQVDQTGANRWRRALTGLTPSTSYVSKAQVRFAAGWSDWSDEVEWETWGLGYADVDFMGCPPSWPGIHINPDANPPTNRLGLGWFHPHPGEPLRGVETLVFRWSTSVPIWDIYLSDDLGATWALLESGVTAGGVDGDRLVRYTLTLDTTGYADGMDYRLKAVSTNTDDDDVLSLSFPVDNGNEVRWWKQHYGSDGDRWGKVWAQEGETWRGTPTGDGIWKRGADGGIGAICGHQHAGLADLTCPPSLGGDITIRFYIWSGEGGLFALQGRDDTEGFICGVALFAEGASTDTAKGLYLGVANSLSWVLDCCSHYLTSGSAGLTEGFAKVAGNGFYTFDAGSAMVSAEPLQKMWFRAMNIPPWHRLTAAELALWPLMTWRNGPTPGDDVRAAKWTCARRWEQYALRVRAELDPGDYKRLRIRWRLDGMGVVEPSGSYWHADEWVESTEEFDRGLLALMSQQTAMDLYGAPGGARVFLSWSALPLEPEGEPDIEPVELEPWNPPQAGQPCTVVLQVYDDAGERVIWEVGDDEYHHASYLCVPENYGEQELDFVAGAATIGQVEVVVVDKAQTAGDQDSGWMTERLGEDGLGVLHGRRCRVLRYVDYEKGWVVIADGPASSPRMDASYSAYRWIVRDTRETERKVRAFIRSDAWLLPAGREHGWGAYVDADGDDAWIVPPTDPLVGIYEFDASDPYAKGLVSLGSYWADYPFGFLLPPSGEVGEEVVVKGGVESLFAGHAEELGDPRPILITWEHLEVLWRVSGSGDEFQVVRPTHLIKDGSGRVAVYRDGRTRSHSLAAIYDAELADGSAVRAAVSILVRGVGAVGSFPNDGDTVDIAVRYTGEPTNAAPQYVEGITTGQLLKKLYDGEYSYPDVVTGEHVPTGIRYHEADLLAMDDPVLLRITEPVTDGRAWAEKMIYAPTGWCPALDNDGRISPKSQVPPASFDDKLRIHNAVTEPSPDWGAGERIINVIRFVYPRYYRVGIVDAEAVDRLEARDVEVIYRDVDSVNIHTEIVAEYDGQAFAAIGDSHGDPLTIVNAESAHGHARDRNRYIMHRYRDGAPIIEVPVMRDYCWHLRAGDWVRVDLSWFPNYQTQRRGMECGGQILAIYDVDCEWRILLIEKVSAYLEES